MNNDTITAKIIEVLGSAYDDAYLVRFSFDDSWREDTTYLYNGLMNALKEYNDADEQDPQTFKELLIDSISNEMEARGMIESYEEMARKLVRECYDELFEPHHFFHGEEIPKYRHQIAAMEEHEIVELLADQIAEQDSSTFEDAIANMNVKVRLMYSPGYIGIDESLNYGSHIGEFRCDDNFERALRFFNITPTELKTLMEERGDDGADEFLKLKDFELMKTSIASKERVVTLLENTYRYWLPGCIFNVEAGTLLDFAPGKTVTVKGGTVCCFDIYNGSGSDESMENDCALTFKIINPDELLNLSDGSKFGDLHDRVFGVVKSVFNAEVEVTE